MRKAPTILMGFAILLWVKSIPIASPQAPRPASEQEFRVDPLRGPVDLGLPDPALVGAIDIHSHLDPFVFKTHQDPSSAGMAYMVRKHATPGLEVFGRMALNLSTGGINIAALEHFTQIKGGWGRIVEMPTRDSERSTRDGVSRNGELLPEVKYFLEVMARLRTVDSNGRLALATGHASPEEHLLLAREGRRLGLQVVLTHPGDIPQLADAAKIGAYIEMTVARVIRNETEARSAAGLIRKIGAGSIILSTDCGQMSNPFPSDCIALAAKGLRAQGVTDRELDLMLKENPAKLLGLPPLLPPTAGTSPATIR
ncbi:MAG: hypothetical protein HW398_834 [Acidobacteria bacterium]|nr:hypothetical protein [Acidobacteriota bacterium]